MKIHKHEKTELAQYENVKRVLRRHDALKYDRQSYLLYRNT